ncbi:hypothetical protein [Flectobacillus major]|uniref:hypothetical protein n=1 Tax=Flectobacillus major TaxID=103 RepID=UPI0003FD3540|nr:hypothetical protein [Flectobacillus major]
MRVKVADIIIITYITISTLFFFSFAKTDIELATDTDQTIKGYRLYADHPTYVNAYRDVDNIVQLLLLKPNYLGPTLILGIFGENLNIIYFLNISLLIICFILIKKYLSIDKLKLVVLLLINPVLFFSLFSINKEIISLLAIILFCIYLEYRKFIILFISIVIALLARKELSLLFIILFLIFRFIPFWDIKNKLVLLAIIIIITIANNLIINNFQSISEYLLESDASVNSDGTKGTITMLNEIQNKYGYVFVVIPKIMLNLFGSLIRLDSLFNFDDVYNNFVIWVQSLLFFVLIPIALFNTRNSQDLFLAKVLFTFNILCILFAFIPISQNRYYFPCYFLIILLICNKNTSKHIKPE